jgi:hypothetical protein
VSFLETDWVFRSPNPEIFRPDGEFNNKTVTAFMGKKRQKLRGKVQKIVKPAFFGANRKGRNYC